MFKRTLCAAAIAAVFGLGCDTGSSTTEIPVTSNSQIIGLWLLSQTSWSESETLDSLGVRTTDTWNYASNYDAGFDGYMNAYYYEFTADSLRTHSYDRDAGIWTHSSGYRLENGKIITWDSTWTSTADTIIRAIDYDTMTATFIGSDFSVAYYGTAIDTEDVGIYVHETWSESGRFTRANELPTAIWEAGLSPDAREPDNSTASAKPLAVNATTPKLSITPNDTDCHLLTGLTAGTTYLVTAHTFGYFGTEKLFNADGTNGPDLYNYNPQNENEDNQYLFIATATSHILMVGGPYSDQSNYTLKVQATTIVPDDSNSYLITSRAAARAAVESPKGIFIRNH